MSNKERMAWVQQAKEQSHQIAKKGWKEQAAEISKWIDKWGIKVGLAMMAVGIIHSPLIIPGAVMAGSSVVTRWMAEKVRQREERKRRRRDQTVYQH